MQSRNKPLLRLATVLGLCLASTGTAHAIVVATSDGRYAVDSAHDGVGAHLSADPTWTVTSTTDVDVTAEADFVGFYAPISYTQYGHAAPGADAQNQFIYGTYLENGKSYSCNLKIFNTTTPATSYYTNEYPFTIDANGNYIPGP